MCSTLTRPPLYLVVHAAEYKVRKKKKKNASESLFLTVWTIDVDSDGRMFRWLADGSEFSPDWEETNYAKSMYVVFWQISA